MFSPPSGRALHSPYAPTPSSPPSSSPAFNERLSRGAPAPPRTASPGPFPGGGGGLPGAPGAGAGGAGPAAASGAGTSPGAAGVGPYGGGAAPSPFAPRRSPASRPASARRPPTRSLLDAGPGVMALRAPAGGASPAGGAYTPVSARSAAPAGAADERWVTVFGFPPASEPLVLRELRRHGEVVRSVPGRGNWVHVQYRTGAQAEIARHRPWRMLPGAHVMVGVTVCTEPDAVAHMGGDEEGVGDGVGTPGRVSLVPSPGGRGGYSSPNGLRTPRSVATGGERYAGASPPATPGMHTPASAGVMGSTARMAVSPNPESILKPPAPPRGIVSYISDWMSSGL